MEEYIIDLNKPWNQYEEGIQRPAMVLVACAFVEKISSTMSGPSLKRRAYNEPKWVWSEEQEDWVLLQKLPLMGFKLNEGYGRVHN